MFPSIADCAKGGRTLNIYDVSKRAGVSIATVSRVINNSDRVSEKTKQRVLKVMEELGYVPNAFARGLGLNTMKTIGILCPTSADPFFAQGVAYLEKALRQNGYDCLLCCTEFDLDACQSSVALLLSKHVDSIVFMGSSYVDTQDQNNEYIRQAAQSVPVMLVNAALTGENIYAVLCDDYSATLDATSFLLDLGRKDVLYLYNSRTYSAQKKLKGYRDALVKHGKPVRDALIHYVSPDCRSIPQIRDELSRLVKTGLTFDAVMTSEDSLAVGTLKYARAARRSVPKSLSVVGYNNSSLCECVEPELTSVDNKLEVICGQCVETLLSVLQGKQTPNKTIFSAELIKRGTT